MANRKRLHSAPGAPGASEAPEAPAAPAAPLGAERTAADSKAATAADLCDELLSDVTRIRREEVAGLKPGKVSVQFTKMMAADPKPPNAPEQFDITFRASSLAVLHGDSLTRAKHQFETGAYPLEATPGEGALPAPGALEITADMDKDLRSADRKGFAAGIMVQIDVIPVLWNSDTEGCVATGRILAVNTTREEVDRLMPGQVRVHFTKVKVVGPGQQRTDPIEQFEYVFRASNLYLLPDYELAGAIHQFATGVYPPNVEDEE